MDRPIIYTLIPLLLVGPTLFIVHNHTHTVLGLSHRRLLHHI